MVAATDENVVGCRVRIAGTIRFPPGAESLDVARVRVSVLDVSEQDAPSRVLTAVDLPAVAVPAAGLALPFALDADVGPADRRTLVVRAHADRNGSGRVEPGDLVTTTANPVRADPMELRVEPVSAQI